MNTYTIERPDKYIGNVYTTGGGKTYEPKIEKIEAKQHSLSDGTLTLFTTSDDVKDNFIKVVKVYPPGQWLSLSIHYGS